MREVIRFSWVPLALMMVGIGCFKQTSEPAFAQELMPSWSETQGSNIASLQAAGWQLNEAAQATGAFTMSGNGNFRLRDDEPKGAPVATLPFNALSDGTLSLRMGVAGLRNQNGMLRLLAGDKILLEFFLLNNEQGTIKTGAGIHEFTGTGWLNQARDLHISWSGAEDNKVGTVSVAFDARTLEGRSSARVINAPFLATGKPDGLRLEVGFGSAVNRTLLASKFSLKSGASSLPDFSLPEIDHSKQDFETKASLTDWRAENSELALTAQHAISGKQSLRWSWNASNPRLTFENRDAFDAVTDKSSLGLWVYNSIPSTELLQAELLNGKQVVSTFWYRLNYKGWRPLGAVYSQLANGKSFDGVRLSAPTLKNGSLDIDYFNTNATGTLKADYQQPWVDDLTLLKTPQKTLFSSEDWSINRPYLPTLPQAVSTVQRADLQKLTARLLPPIERPRNGLSAAAIEPLRAQIQNWNIKRVDGFTTGLPVLHESFNQPPASIKFDEYIKFIGKVVEAFGQAKEPAQIDELRQMYLLMVDHWLESGWAEGNSQFGWLGVGYEMRRWSPYFLDMRDELQKAGRLEAVMKAVAWSMGNGREIAAESFAKHQERISIDVLLNYNLAIPTTALALGNEKEAVQRLDTFVRYLNYFFAESGLIGPDGTVYHHWMHNILYGSYAVPHPLSTYIDALMQTESFRINRAAHERLRAYAENNAFSGFGPNFAANMNPRAGTPAKWDVSSVAKVLAFWGTPDRKQTVDERMAALYLTLNKKPDDEDAKKFQALGIKPLTQTGHLTLNGGVASIQRRDDWLAVAVGMNQAYRGLEIYGWLWSNNYGRYARNGSVMVQTPQAIDGGYKAEGWNGSFWPAATSLASTSAELFDYYRIYNNTSRMAGGTSLENNGIWGMDYQGTELQFLKSAFFFDNRVTVITSGIKSEQNRPVVTTLYQSALPKTDAPTYLNGQSIKEFPDSRQSAPNSSQWLMDNNGNGYYLSALDAPLKISRSTQEWTYMFPKYLKNAEDNPLTSEGTKYKLRFPNIADNEKFYNSTKGDFALAYLEHGTNPTNAGIAYTMLVQTTPEKMATFANQMATPQTAPVQIIRKDNSAHIVFDRETQSTGYVLFTPADNLTGLVKSVDRPCFVMTQSVGNTLKMSVANTVLSDKNQSLPVRLTLPGAWKLPATATKRIKVNASQTETYLEVTPDSNLAFEFQLVK